MLLRRTLLAPITALGLLLGLLATMLTVSSAGGAAPAGSSAAAALPNSIDYVALGDSYSAGPLIPAQRPDPAGCLRSTNNYPAYLAGYLGVTTYRDVTCSGARVRDFRNRQETILPGPPPPPQVDALSAGTDLVTIGIGGNDFGLFGSLIDNCERVAERNPQGKPCKRFFTNKRGVDTKIRDAQRIEGHVVRAVRAVRRHAPNAKVYVVGYPRLLPSTGTCPEVPFAKGDYVWGRRVERLLNLSIQQAASKNGARYVDLYPATRGHDACADERAWINGSELKPDRAANFHPFKVGERGMSRAIYRRITGLVAPRHEDAQPPPGSVIPNTP